MKPHNPIVLFHQKSCFFSFFFAPHVLHLHLHLLPQPIDLEVSKISSLLYSGSINLRMVTMLLNAPLSKRIERIYNLQPRISSLLPISNALQGTKEEALICKSVMNARGNFESVFGVRVAKMQHTTVASSRVFHFVLFYKLVTIMDETHRRCRACDEIPTFHNCSVPNIRQDCNCVIICFCALKSKRHHSAKI